MARNYLSGRRSHKTVKAKGAAPVQPAQSVLDGDGAAPAGRTHDVSRLGADFKLRELTYDFGGDAEVVIECFLPDGTKFRKYRYVVEVGKKICAALPIDLQGRLESPEPAVTVTASEQPIYRRVDYRWCG